MMLLEPHEVVLHAFNGGPGDVWPLPQHVIPVRAGLSSLNIPMRPARTSCWDEVRIVTVKLERLHIVHVEDRLGDEVVIAKGWQRVGWNSEAGVLLLGDGREVRATL